MNTTPTEKFSSYFTAKAREFMHKAGGDPDLAGPLAEWAQEARRINNTGRGVLVAEDGTIVAQTHLTEGFVRAWYVSAEDSRRYGLSREEVGLARHDLGAIVGQRLVHATMSDVCLGAGKHVKEV